jgi:hypothetical protein
LATAAATAAAAATVAAATSRMTELKQGEQRWGERLSEWGSTQQQVSTHSPVYSPYPHPHFLIHTSRKARATSIDVRANFARCYRRWSGRTTRGYQWYCRFHMTPRYSRCSMYLYPLRVRCTRVQVRCRKT